VTGTDLALPTPLVLLFAGLLGAILGSFLNVVIHRLPRKQEIVVTPSACPSCGARIAPWDNVPILSWVLLGGRCRSCKAPISARYPVVEALGAALAVMIAWYTFVFHGWGEATTRDLAITAGTYLVFCLALLAITLIDLEHRIIPDKITFPVMILGLALVRWTDVTWIEALIGAAVGFGLLLLVGIVYEKLTGIEGMGGGDVKMAAMMGAFLGWKGIFLTIFLGSFLGSVAGIITIARGKGGRRTALPFGTFLAPAAVLVLFFGEALINWYLGLVWR
jgi:leader peptidase (prepilin peptidase)/N-methyltransferase